MPINSIPAKPPFQPRFPDEPETLPDPEGKEFTISSQTIDESGYIFERFVTVTRAQKWKRVFAATPECGNPVSETITRKTGVSRTVTSELSSKLGVSFEGLSAELGAKLGVSVTISEEDTAKFNASTVAPKCKSRTYVVWQLIDIYNIDIIDEFYGWPPDFTFQYRFEMPLNVFDPDCKDFPNSECCTEEVALQKSEGFDCPYYVKFDGVEVILLGKTGKNGRVSFADSVKGEYQIGGLVPYSALSEDLQNGITLSDKCPDLTFGTIRVLDESLGFYCNELNLVNQSGFVRSQERILSVFNAPRSEFLAATGGVGEKIIDRVIAARADGGFDSLRAIENLAGFSRADMYQLVVPTLTNGYLRLSNSKKRFVDVISTNKITDFAKDMLNKPLSELPMLGPSTVEDIKLKLGAVNVGDLVAIGSEVNNLSNTDGSFYIEQIFNPDRLRSELIKVDLRRGLTNLDESDIDDIVDAITPTP